MTPTGKVRRRPVLAVFVAFCSALFFTLTYVLNRASASDGGHWAWTASLRYFITLPLLLPLMPWQGGIRPILTSITAHPWVWLKCGAIGFLLFYATLSYAASSGPSWLVAGTFQFTVIAGMLCSPFIYQDERRRIPSSGIAISLLILSGVFMMQAGQSGESLDTHGWIAAGCVIVGAVAYPLGNRLLLLHLERTNEDLTAAQRVFGMTLVSQPLWILVAAFGFTQAGLPSPGQVGLAAGVALSAGVIATILFFEATGMVRDQPVALGAAESMQASELIFAMLLGVAFLNESWPRGVAMIGAILVILGIICFAMIVSWSSSASSQEIKAMRSDKGG
ncbi:multidrug resistance efflux transporter family protein [Luteolibacter sp. SL250]|uniref:multidrug resistance efflux transporter family protein n=1 Tax=Luteolibacter sp. SL250 TaxID=2995170 RepID=UPI002271DDE4|nr:multidrug resistance efflux transporter family protein [Luteolibacter sp. SL250]WAC18186.1 multidrug resistance efflux transporter family protein [Luteolibacter sp. SL250]